MSDPATTLRILLEQARAALGRGDKVAGPRPARGAGRLDPHSEAAWLTLAAVSEPRPALAYAARALEVNPRSQPARRAIRWAGRQLPRRERPPGPRGRRLPTPLPSRVFSPPRAAAPAWAIGPPVGLGAASPPADPRQPQQESSPVAKASFT